MKTKKLMYVIGILIISSCLVEYSLFAGEKELKVSRFVTIESKDPREIKLGLDPSTLIIEPGTTVVWVNFSRTPVELLFLNNKVSFAADCPANFFIGKNGAYESGKICIGCTASLCFIEKGKYEYVFSTSSTFYPSKMKEQRGMIWIK